jgi:hypothetical protein
MTRLPRLRVSVSHHDRLTRVLELGILAVVVAGTIGGDATVVMNAGVALGVTFVPSALERDARVTMDSGLVLWITAAVFLHALGALEVGGFSFYADVWWWDHLTHAATGSLVAGAGYSVVRAVDEHTDAIVLTPRFTFVFTLLFVLAFGVYWEVLEFALGHVTVGGETPLTQYGVEDTMKDLAFDAVGGVLAATFGAAHLSSLVGDLERRLDDHTDP